MDLNKIKDLCKKNGITLRELEVAANLGTNSVYKWGERTPSVDKVQRVASVLGVTMDELLKEGTA